MSKVVMDSTKLTALGNKVRAKTSSSDLMTVDEMTDAVDTLGDYADRDDIRTALAGKGVSASDHDFADFAGDIASIGEITLPPEYQKVDYLTSTGTQRIETGIINDTLDVSLQYEFDILYPAVSSRQVNGSQGGFYVGVVNNMWQVGQSSTNNTGITAQANKWYKIFARFNGKPDNVKGNGIALFTVDGVTAQWGAYLDISTNVANNFVVCLFSLNGQTLPSSCSIGQFKIWQNDVFVRHLIPCYRKADKVIGMYDIVNNQFYTNAGTGSFTCYPAPPA